MSPAYMPHFRSGSRVPTPGLPTVEPIHVMYVTPFTSVGASACTQRTSGQFAAGSNWKFAMIESSPTPENPCAGTPPLNNTQMSEAGIPTIGLLSDAITTTFNRALFFNTCVPSSFGQRRAFPIAPPVPAGAAAQPFALAEGPSQGTPATAEAVPVACGT